MRFEEYDVVVVGAGHAGAKVRLSVRLMLLVVGRGLLLTVQ